VRSSSTLVEEEALMSEVPKQTIVLELITKHAKVNGVSKTAARKALIDTGIYTSEGKLRAEYGGERAKKNRTAD
jgi:hypothetical protein